MAAVIEISKSRQHTPPQDAKTYPPHPLTYRRSCEARSRDRGPYRSQLPSTDGSVPSETRNHGPISNRKSTMLQSDSAKWKIAAYGRSTRKKILAGPLAGIQTQVGVHRNGLTARIGVVPCSVCLALSGCANGKGSTLFHVEPLFMSAMTYSPTHFRVQYNRPSGA
jgi:hypothetical protein